MPRTFYSSPLPIIQEEDGSPKARFRTLKIPNGSLTDNGDGTVSISFLFLSESTYFIENGSTLELYFKGVLVQSWTVQPMDTGQPMGAWLGIWRTYTI